MAQFDMNLPSAFLIVRNRTYQLAKRSNTPTAPWYVRLQVQGVRTNVSTKTADLITAQDRAAGFIEAALDGDLNPIHSQTAPRASSRTTIGEVIASLNASDIPSGPRYADALVKFITAAKKIPHAKALSQPAKILNPALVHAFQHDADPEQHGALKLTPPPPPLPCGSLLAQTRQFPRCRGRLPRHHPEVRPLPLLQTTGHGPAPLMG